ncbi:MAG: hypothetical protein IGQ45_10630 [Cyanobacterium sp. T60_A2020_053]|nr:hypothetical protein [Cyanobacterium sp. T60_A2020_053]
MELIICFGLAVSVFALVIALIIGLVSAPTPLLLGILVMGILFTQKSINSLTAPSALIYEEKEQEKIEKVEYKQPKGEQNVLKSMTYRGSHYNHPTSLDRIALNSQKKTKTHNSKIIG